MKINQNKKSRSIKKLAIGIVLVLTLAAGLYVIYRNNSTDDKTATKDREPSVISQPSIQQQEIKPETTVTKDTKTDEGTPPEKTNPGFVSTPIVQPSMSAAFPIENEHYKIAKTSESNYTVTLYPIANNPDYSNYNAQLKAYKNEALQYLAERFGDVSRLSIIWVPSDAASL